MDEFYDVFLDTNILQGWKFDFKKPEILALRFYLENTKKKAYTSSVVIEELKKNYEEAIQERLTKIDKNLKEIQKYDSNKVWNIDERTKELKETTEKIIQEFNSKIIRQLSFIKLIETTKDWFDECLKRATKKIPPCHKDEQFKDNIIWLSFLSLLEKDKNFAFISNDQKAFGEKNSFHSYLQQDVDALWANVKYYTGSDALKDFLEKHKSDFAPILDEQKILEIFRDEEAKDQLLSYTLRGNSLSTFLRSSLSDFDNIEITYWPELYGVYDIYIIDKDEDEITFTFTMQYDFVLLVSTEYWEFENDDMHEYLTWEIKYNLKTQKFEVDYDSFESDYETFDLERAIEKKKEKDKDNDW